MRGALEFWKFFFGLVGGAMLLAVPVALCAGIGWLVAGGNGAAVGIAVGGVAVMVGVPTWSTWDRRKP